MEHTTGYRYEGLAAEMEAAIGKGVFPAGARLPSVREASRRHRVSVSTVLEAYARLEERGLVESRPKSGYFVRPPAAPRRVLPTSNPRRQPGEVSVADLAMQVLARAREPGMVSLGAGYPDPRFLPLAALARCLARAARVHGPRAWNYAPPEGAPALRAALSRLLLDSGCNESPDGIVICNGALEALGLALRAVAAPGDVVAVESPVFFGVLQILEGLGLRALELPTHPRRGVDLDALESAVSRSQVRACILAPTYQNPLGFRMPDADKRAAVELLARHGVVLVEDDVLGDLGVESPRPVAARSFDETDNVILCGSFSKTVSPALRLGWLAPGRHLAEVLRQKFLLNYTTATVPQLGLAEFLEGNRFRRAIQSAARSYAARQQSMRDAVLEHFPEGTTCSAPAGGFFLWVEMPRGHDAMALYERALAAGITISPGHLFTRANGYASSFRLTVAGTDAGELGRAARDLGRLAHGLGGKTI